MGVMVFKRNGEKIRNMIISPDQEVKINFYQSDDYKTTCRIINIETGKHIATATERSKEDALFDVMLDYFGI